MKQLHINDIELNKVYYSVICGSISEIMFLEKNKLKCCILHLSKISDYWVEEIFLSDIGVYHPNNNYLNDLNIVVKTYFEALQIISNEEYKIRLETHNDRCSSWLYYD